MGGALNFEWADWALVSIAALQGLWLVVLLIWAARSHRLTSKGPLKRVRKAWSLSGAQKAELFKRTKEIEEAHQASVQVFLRGVLSWRPGPAALCTDLSFGSSW